MHLYAAPAGRDVYRNAIRRETKPRRGDMCTVVKIVQTLVYFNCVSNIMHPASDAPRTTPHQGTNRQENNNPITLDL